MKGLFAAVLTAWILATSATAGVCTFNGGGGVQNTLTRDGTGLRLNGREVLVPVAPDRATVRNAAQAWKGRIGDVHRSLKPGLRQALRQAPQVFLEEATGEMLAFFPVRITETVDAGRGIVPPGWRLFVVYFTGTQYISFAGLCSSEADMRRVLM